MPRKQGQRHPVGHLQFEMAVVLKAIRIEPEQERGDEGGAPRPGQMRRQSEHRHAGQHEARDQQDVVHDNWMHASGQQRHGRERRPEHRVGVGQRQELRIEDVGTEQRPRIALQGMEDPTCPPHREERIPQIRHRIHVPKLGPQERRAERAQTQSGPDQLPPRHGRPRHGINVDPAGTQPRDAHAERPHARQHQAQRDDQNAGEDRACGVVRRDAHAGDPRGEAGGNLNLHREQGQCRGDHVERHDERKAWRSASGLRRHHVISISRSPSTRCFEQSIHEGAHRHPTILEPQGRLSLTT